MEDAAVLAAKVSALKGELAAKSSRLADLEARVSLLEAENTRLRRAMAIPKGEVMDTGEKVPIFGQLEAGLGGKERKSVEIVGRDVASDVIEISDGEEKIAIDVKKGGGVVEGVLAVPTPRKCVVRVVTGDSEDEDDIEDAEGGCESEKKNNHYENVGVEDDDVSIITQGKKCAARVITSDSENDDGHEEVHGSGKDGNEEGAIPITTPSRKRALQVLASDSENENDSVEGVHLVPELRLKHALHMVASDIEIAEDNEHDEDDGIPISEVVKKMRRGRVSEAGNELGKMEDSPPPRRRSARLAKAQSKRRPAACKKLDYVESSEDEEGEGDLRSEDDDMEGFIVNDLDCSENDSASTEESSPEREESNGEVNYKDAFSPRPEESDGEVNYKDVLARIGHKRTAKNWDYEGEMLSAFAEHPELCLKAVCALYRQQTKHEQSAKATFMHNKRGFSQIDALRGSNIAEFLLDGDASGPLKKTVQDLEEYDRNALEFCRKVAERYSKQLFAIYQNKEDLYFLL